MFKSRQRQPSSAMRKKRNWAEMPDELMTNILGRLDTVEKLTIARKVCSTWRRICKDPSMWKSIYVQKKIMVDANYSNDEYKILTKQAVDLSCGELIDISMEGLFCTHPLLDHILLRSSKLNSLCLTDCYNMSSSRLSLALEYVPNLEKLHLTYTNHIVEDVEDFIPNCPQLKSFKLDKVFIRVGFKNDKDALAIANNMPELRHLELYGNDMTNIGLQAILNGCPHLEYLDVRTCGYLRLKTTISGRLCMERIDKLKGFKGPRDSTKNCGFRPRIYAYNDFSDDEDYNVDEDDHDIDRWHYRFPGF